MSTKKVESLTPEQEADIVPHRDFWLNQLLSCKHTVDKEKAREAVKWLYKTCNLEEPIVFFVDSPFAAQVATNYFERIYNKEKININFPIPEKLRDGIMNTIRENVKENNLGNLGEFTGDLVKLNYFDTSYYGNVSDYGWVAFVDYFIKHDLIETDKKEDFLKFKELLLTNVYDMIQLEAICIVSNMPKRIVRNAAGRLHNPEGYAIEFYDGYGQHYINGRFIPEDIYNKAQTITKQEFIKEVNSEYKGAWYEILGQVKMMELLGAKEIDSEVIKHKNGDLETVTLLKTTDVFEEIGNEPFAWVKMVCPSTGTQYLQGVEPHHKSALEAISSLSMFDKNEYSFDMRS